MKSFIRTLALAAATLWVASAQAGTRIGNEYCEDLFSGSTCSAGICILYSAAATPTDAYVRIKHVACDASTLASNPLITARLQVWNGVPNTSGATVLKQLTVRVPQPSVASSNNYYSIDSDALFLVGAGRYIALYLGLSGSAGMGVNYCGVTGDLVTPQ
ncbi:MAG: hypothetical protein JOZ16_17240 [Methylobacteriaceae bacterium]|nr:hypothetical protein [Methylobacteriaceae bacterium]